MRNYKNEYKKYQGTSVQKKKRASRNAARNALKKTGAVKKGDGRDVNHRNGNPMDNRAKNLSVTTKRANRSFPRNSKAGKR
jgi:transposase-like protein|tara:strand:+ start:377 stop:619 length:243 start_codon:yes stop_codon:yes gene_type:complete